MSNNTNATPNPLVKLPSMRGSATSAPSPCRCGCGALVARSFAPGHDARLAGFVKRVLIGQLDLAWILANAGEGVAAAVDRELAARTLAHVKWEAFPVVVADDEQVG